MLVVSSPISLSRMTRAHDGVLPDVSNNDAFDWITDYARSHRTIASPRDFKLTDADYASFSNHMIEKKFD